MLEGKSPTNTVRGENWLSLDAGKKNLSRIQWMAKSLAVHVD